MLKKIDIYIDAYISTEGVHIYTDPDGDETITYFKLVNDFIESHLVPTDPPSIRDDGREEIMRLSLIFDSLSNYLRKQVNEYPDWKPKNNMGHRD
jgi:hypothetical protein